MSDRCGENAMNEMSKIGSGNITAEDMDQEQLVTYRHRGLPQPRISRGREEAAVAEDLADGRAAGGLARCRRLDHLQCRRRIDHRRPRRARATATPSSAFHNVCPHRGRQLVSVPDGVHSVRGKGRKNFVCGFHGWTFDLDGNNTYILDPQDWQNKLTPEMTCLSRGQGRYLGRLYLHQHGPGLRCR